MKKINFLIGVFCFIFVFGCQSTHPQKSNLSAGVVKKTIKIGETTQAEVIRLFGSPNIVTKNKEGNEVWNYSKQSFDSKSGGFGGGLILFGGGKAFSSAASSSVDVIIEFDNRDIVKDYDFVSSQF